MEKSPEAFRTISEVADWLGVPTHVLRFWESRFAQIKPVKRAGGRRYYRPTDMALIGGIKRLLHDDGMTIRGAQKLLREKGVKHVAALSQPLDGSHTPADVVEGSAVEVTASETAPSQTDDKVERQAAAPDQKPAEPAPEPAEPTAVEAEAQPNLLDADASASAPPPADTTPEPAPPVIATPADVPDTDPEDDDTTFPGTPGLAARVRLADTTYLARNRDALRLLRNHMPPAATA